MAFTLHEALELLFDYDLVLPTKTYSGDSKVNGELVEYLGSELDNEASDFSSSFEADAIESREEFGEDCLGKLS